MRVYTILHASETKAGMSAANNKRRSAREWERRSFFKNASGSAAHFLKMREGARAPLDSSARARMPITKVRT